MSDKKLPIKEIEKYIDLFNDSGLASMEITIKGMNIGLKSYEKNISNPVLPPRSDMTPLFIPGNLPHEAVQEHTDTSLGQVIVSPINGIFYASASPTSEPYVEVGSKVKKGDVLCIVESMKVMNEIKSSHEGKVVKMIAKDGDSLSRDDVLMYIE